MGSHASNRRECTRTVEIRGCALFLLLLGITGGLYRLRWGNRRECTRTVEIRGCALFLLLLGITGGLYRLRWGLMPTIGGSVLGLLIR